MPKVTVLMSVYNGRRYLSDAIESILNQTWPDFEFLIINDGSTDNSREIIKSFNDPRIRLVDNSENIGLVKSLNRGLELAQGELIARQDADDISYPNRLDEQVRFLNMHPQIMLLGTGVKTIDESGKPHPVEWNVPTGLTAIRWHLMFENAFVHTSAMYRRNIVRDVLGGYDTSFARAQDYELWSRIVRKYPVENLASFLVAHRFQYLSVTKRLLLPDPPIKKIVLENLRVFLKYSDIPEQWADFIIRFQRREHFCQKTDWKQAAEMYDRIWSRYCRLYREARSNRSICLHLSTNFKWLAYYSAPRNRCVSAHIYLKARKLSQGLNKSHPSLIWYLALWVFGDRVRRIYHHLATN
jgi:glycosyltransferase involved in cell wall biosynthesis